MKILQKKHYLRRPLLVICIGLTASILAFFASNSSLFKHWELKTYDYRMNFTKNGRVKPSDVAMFYVDEPSLRNMEAQGINWPWPRELYASALNFCHRGGARAVVFDLFFSEDSVYGVGDDEAFADGVSKGPPSYFVLFLSKNEAASADTSEKIAIKKSSVPFAPPYPPWLEAKQSLQSLPINPLMEVATGFGNAQTPPDQDGVYRRVDLIDRFGDAVIPSIDLKVVSDLKNISQLSWPTRYTFFLDSSEIPLDDDGRMMIRYYGSSDTFPTYSLGEVILSNAQLNEGKTPSIDPSVVKGKIVIIGLAAPGLYDMKSSPLARTLPGSEIHATIMENLLTSDFIRPIHSWAVFIITIICGLLVGLGLLWMRNSLHTVLWLLMLFFAVISSGVALFSYGIWLPIIAPLGALVATSFTMIFYNYLTEGRKKREIRKAFGQYLSPHIVSEIAKDPEALRLGGDQRDITVFFSDIADFTTISEKTSPPKLVEQLNEYFSVMTRIIQEQQGTLDKYIGDAIMAFWGAPLQASNHAVLAVTAALNTQAGKNLSLATRIGIHTGPAIVGNIGSDIRFNYTAIGDTVNLASRLEGLNKKFGTCIIISESTYQQSTGAIEARRIGRVRVKGREEPIGIFEPLGFKGDFGRLGTKGVSEFAKAMVYFEAGKFKEAETIFKQIASEFNDTTSLSYQNMISSYIQNPPDRFDGVITFTTK